MLCLGRAEPQENLHERNTVCTCALGSMMEVKHQLTYGLCTIHPHTGS